MFPSKIFDLSSLNKNVHSIKKWSVGKDIVFSDAAYVQGHTARLLNRPMWSNFVELPMNIFF